jgi:hypothetical protein
VTLVTTDSQERIAFTIVTANVVPSSLILFVLMIAAMHSPKRRFLEEPHISTSLKMKSFIVTRENLKSYIALTGWAL